MSTEICSASLFLSPPQPGTVTVGAVVSVGKVVVGLDELGTASGAFELLAGGVLRASANLGASFGTECPLGGHSAGSLPAGGK